jgi:hypothetical protein
MRKNFIEGREMAHWNIFEYYSIILTKYERILFQTTDVLSFGAEY